MPPAPLDWPHLLLRLAAALLAGLFLGVDRTARGRPAGMRTTMLVAVAGALAMVLAERLAAPNSFLQLNGAHFDPVRLAQGILTGMGFIGAGAIVRKENAVLGVTTAATLWFATVVGLCFGAAQWGPGAAALVIGLLILWPMHTLEERIQRQRAARFSITLSRDSTDEAELRARLSKEGYRTSSWSIAIDRDSGERTLACQVEWNGRPREDTLPAFVAELAADPQVRSIRWEPVLT
jgi:putative Mg2+ transporter-C (MgtC) family protein